jgi:hypothetical protein
MSPLMLTGQLSLALPLTTAVAQTDPAAGPIKTLHTNMRHRDLGETHGFSPPLSAT